MLFSGNFHPPSAQEKGEASRYCNRVRVGYMPADVSTKPKNRFYIARLLAVTEVWWEVQESWDVSLGGCLPMFLSVI
jgi:hypothetical protein